MSAAPVIQASNLVMRLGKGAGQVQAVRGVDLTLETGELTLLMGPSGSGKTTLLSILGCILTPSEGDVRICGTSTNAANAGALARLRRDHIGFIFQSYHLFPTLNALDNVRLALDVRGVRGASAIAEARKVLETVGLADKWSARPSQMSGGEQQRVAIARAIVGNPPAILADEPTGALDGENGRAVMTILANIAKDRSHSVLVVTHDPRVIPYADRIVRIEDGRIMGEERRQAT